MFLLPIVLLSAIPYGIYCLIRREADRRRVFAQRFGVAASVVLAVLLLMFVTAESFSDAPSSTAAAYTIAWLLPALGCSALAIRRPAAFRPLSIAVVALLGVAAVATLVWAESWRSFIDENGPLLGVAALAAAVPVALLGWTQPGLAGRLLLVLAVIPIVSGPSTSGSALGSPMAVGALWLLFSASKSGADGDAKVPTEGATPPVAG